jgi:hypothetical protein
MLSPYRLSHADLLHETSAAATVGVRLGDLLPLLIEAAGKQQVWVKDFFDDSVEIPQDLYDVVLAYQQQRKQAV